MKKRRLEADLDPTDWPVTRPGAATAKRALELAKGGPEKKGGTRKTRPGAHAARRALAGIKRQRSRGR